MSFNSAQIHPAYFDTRFRLEGLEVIRVDSCAIVSAWATTGETWCAKKNHSADVQLYELLTARGSYPLRIHGYSPTTGHSEPSWMCDLDLIEACDVGTQFHQDAIYWIYKGELFVVLCALGKRVPVSVANFRARLDHPTL